MIHSSMFASNMYIWEISNYQYQSLKRNHNIVRLSMFLWNTMLKVTIFKLSMWSNPNGFLVYIFQGIQSICWNWHLQHCLWNSQVLLFVSENVDFILVEKKISFIIKFNLKNDWKMNYNRYNETYGRKCMSIWKLFTRIWVMC